MKLISALWFERLSSQGYALVIYWEVWLNQVCFLELMHWELHFEGLNNLLLMPLMDQNYHPEFFSNTDSPIMMGKQINH